MKIEIKIKIVNVIQDYTKIIVKIVNNVIKNVFLARMKISAWNVSQTEIFKIIVYVIMVILRMKIRYAKNAYSSVNL